MANALEAYSGKYDWIWFLDSDIVMMNDQLSVYEHILTRALQQRLMRGRDISDCNLIMSLDACDLNTGSMFMRVGPWARALVRQT